MLPSPASQVPQDAANHPHSLCDSTRMERPSLSGGLQISDPRLKSSVVAIWRSSSTQATLRFIPPGPPHAVGARPPLGPPLLVWEQCPTYQMTSSAPLHNGPLLYSGYGTNLIELEQHIWLVGSSQTLVSSTVPHVRRQGYCRLRLLLELRRSCACVCVVCACMRAVGVFVRGWNRVHTHDHRFVRCPLPPPIARLTLPPAPTSNQLA
jgi:hypothetical protein